MEITFSFIVPVYNRPQEIDELLQSMVNQDFNRPFETIVVEDGSTKTAIEVVNRYSNLLNVVYLSKPNTGPGDSRNYGMSRALGNYFLILDSDCILPPNYLSAVYQGLQRNYTVCFGGPDRAKDSFTPIQKAIDYSMTSFWTTGGIRGSESASKNFQPRSFNMGLSKEAFLKSGGFGNIHPGEDPDLTFRLWEAGYTTQLLSDAYVFHKRRISWGAFQNQMHKFGMVRPILNKWHPQTAKLVYWFPTIFILFLAIFLLLYFRGTILPLALYGVYFLLLFIDCWIKKRSISVAILAIWASLVQFYGYGTGFLKSTLMLIFSKRPPEELFPQLFFTKKAVE